MIDTKSKTDDIIRNAFSANCRVNELGKQLETKESPHAKFQQILADLLPVLRPRCLGNAEASPDAYCFGFTALLALSIRLQLVCVVGACRVDRDVKWPVITHPLRSIASFALATTARVFSLQAVDPTQKLPNGLVSLRSFVQQSAGDFVTVFHQELRRFEGLQIVASDTG